MNKPGNYPKITALICTLNEEGNLPYVLPNIPSWVDEVILVDGHSTDRTVEIARGFKPDMKVLYQPGKGKGDALKYGVHQATGDIIVTLDMDGETPPEEMQRFVEPLVAGYDFIKGSRLNGKRPSKMPRYRWFGNKVLAITCNLLYGTRFTDVCSGYNAFWKKKFLQLDLSYGANEVGCSMEQQMIVRAKKAGMKIKEIPHTSHGRISGASVINGVRQSVKQGFRDWFIIIGERFHG
ncbi:MAG: glycosyltransferase family 2 protein [Dehalococcoidales bacterium]|nr:glycosyltransferase family 2 protein [Dehalococcoidales bacterium]